MAPKYINKENKRLEIIYKTYEYMVIYGIKKLSIDNLILYLNIGKGTFYHYFSSKDELIEKTFEELTKEYIKFNKEEVYKVKSLEKKLLTLFEVYLKDTRPNKEFLKLYNEYLLIYSNKNTLSLEKTNKDFNAYVKNVLEEIFQEAIDKKQIKDESINLVIPIASTVDGMLLYSFLFDDFNLSEELEKFFKNFLKIIKT